MDTTDRIINPVDLFRNRRHLYTRLKQIPRVASTALAIRRSKHKSLGDLVTHGANVHGNSAALLYEDQVITYRQVENESNRIANYLQEKGIVKGDVIALFMENRPEFIFYLAAISKTGAQAALVNTSQRGKVLTHSITLVDAKTIIVGAELADTVNEVKDQFNLKHDMYFVPDKATLSDASGKKTGYVNIASAAKGYPTKPVKLATPVSSNDTCVFIYTSGTTGMPKATVQKNAKIVKLYLAGAVANPLQTSDVMYCTLPLYHLTALGVCYLATAGSGATFAIARKFSARNFWKDIAKHNATAFGYVGELLRYLMNQPESDQDRQHTLRIIVGNGLKPELWLDFKNRFGIAEIRELYGASESNIMASNLFNIDETVGMVITPYALVEFDTETEEPIKDSANRLKRVAPGEQGLLIGKISKSNPFDGYTDTDKNNSKILRDVFEDGDAWFDSGDVVKDMGCRHIQFVDRTGDTFRWKGENVSTSEVEQVCNHFPEIEESVAYGVEIPQTNGRAGMLAIKLKDSSKAFNEKQFFDFVAKELPPFAIPVFLRFNDELEVTGTFKYQKTGLKKDGFDIKKVKSSVKVALPGGKEYVELTDDMQKKIEANEYRF